MTRDEIYSRLKTNFLTSQNKILDLDEPGVIAGILNAVSIELENLYKSFELLIDRAFVDTATGQDLDRIGALIGCKRKPGTKAVGTLRFYRNTPADRDYFIPKGVRARTPLLPDRTYLSFETTEDATLPTGQSYVDVPAQAVDVGAKYNVASNRVLILETVVQGVTGVINPEPFSGGTDPESDEEFRRRIPLYLESLKRATEDALRSIVLSIPGVQDVLIEDDATPGKVKITVVGTGFDMSQVDAVVNDYKAAGVIPVIQTASTLSVDVSLDLYVIAGYDSNAVKTNVEQAITDYLSNLGLGQPAQIAEVVYVAMGVEGVDNVKNVLLNGVADDVVPSTTEKIVAGTVSATVIT